MKRLLLLFAIVAAAIAAGPAAAAIQVAITSPANGAQALSGIVPVKITASADAGIFGVQLLVDGHPYGPIDSMTLAPYQYQIDWDTSSATQGDHTLQAVAIDWSQPGGGAQQSSATVNVDVGPAWPTISLTAPAALSHVHGTVSIGTSVTSAVNPTTVTYAVDGNSLGSASWNTTSVTDGSHTVSATVTDGRGKKATASAPVTVDNTAPTTSITSPAANSYFSGTLPAQASASDAYGIASVQFAIDGTAVGSPVTQPDSGTQFQYSSSLSLSGLAGGAHQLTSIATDNAGNKTTSAAVSFTLGAAAPTIAITVPPDWTFGLGTVSLTAGVTGGTLPNSVQFIVDGASFGQPVTQSPYVVPWDTTKVADGTHKISATVTDAQGRKATAAVVNVTVDNTKPSVQILSPAANNYFQNSLPAKAHASDAYGIKSVQFAIDGKAVGNLLTAPDVAGQFDYSTTLSLSGVASGIHQLTAITTDQAGNTATSAQVAFYIGSGPPVVTITVPPNWPFASKTTPVSATVTGGVAPVSAQLLVDGAPVGAPILASPYTFPWDTTKVTDGAHTIAVKVTDAAGATATSPTLNETVDNTPPVAVMYLPAPNARVNGPTNFQVHASDVYGVKSVQFTVDGNPVGAVLIAPDAGQQYLYTISFDTSTLTAGTHAIAANVADGAGNVGKPAAVTITTGPIQYLPVLNYHSINPPDGYTIWDQTPAEADQQLAYLKANGYTAITLDQYQQWLSGANIGVAKPVLITVDDGLNSDTSWDALFQTYGMKGVLFIITGFADNLTPGSVGDPNNMSWTTIQQLAANGRWQMAFHAGQYGHGDSYDAGVTIRLNSTQTLKYASTCPYFYTCLGTVTTTTGTGRNRRTTTAPETVAQYQSMVTNEVTAGMAELKQKVPSASMIGWAAPFNDAGQWTNLYNDSTGQVQAWMPGFFAGKFPVVFTQTNPITYAQASGTVGSLSGFNRRYRFEVHTDTTLTQFAAALTDPAFAR